MGRAQFWHGHLLGAATLLLVVGSYASPAGAQAPEQQWAYCVNENNAYAVDLAIGGCTAVIQSGQETTANLAVAFVFRGLAYDSQNNRAQAISDYSQAIGLNPQEGSAFNNRGFAYYLDRDYLRSLADFDQAISIDPQDADSIMNRGMVYLQQGDNARAISAFEEAARLVKNDTPLFGRGIARLRLGQTAEGQADIDATMANYPDLADVYFTRWGVRP